jgi:hypothetical protein
MAIDTALKRASVIQFKQPYRTTLPFPSGTIGTGQRITLGYAYSGITPSPPPGSNVLIQHIGRPHKIAPEFGYV